MVSTKDRLQIDLLTEVAVERERQDMRWGTQDHDDPRWLAILTEELGEVAREVVEELAIPRSRGYQIREELVQVAAVAVAWLEAIDRRQGGGA